MKIVRALTFTCVARTISHSTCCEAHKQIMFLEHRGSFTAKAIKFFTFSVSLSYTHIRTVHVEKIVYDRLFTHEFKCVLCVRVSIRFVGHLPNFVCAQAMSTNKWFSFIGLALIHSNNVHVSFDFLIYLYIASICFKSYKNEAHSSNEQCSCQ